VPPDKPKPYNVNLSVVVVLTATSESEAVKRATRRLDAAGFTVRTDGGDTKAKPDVFESDYWPAGSSYEEEVKQ
jgi:hypothetical protein